MLTRSDVRMIRGKINEALKALAPELSDGARVTLDYGRYGDTDVTFKVNVAVPSEEGGNALSPAERDFTRLATTYGLKPEDLGKEFRNWSGDVFTITGLKPRSRKYPILGKRADGKVFKFAARAVVQGLS